MFTLADICDIAVQIEENGEATYREAAKNTDHKTLANMLNRMADDELQHATWFRKLDRDQDVTHAKQNELEDMGRALLREMVKDKTFSLDAEKLAEAGTIKALLDQSLSFEQDTIVFYQMLESFIDDAHVRDQLKRIIEQENEHIHQITAMRTTQF
jgi:rubrerythrin